MLVTDGISKIGLSVTNWFINVFFNLTSIFLTVICCIAIIFGSDLGIDNFELFLPSILLIITVYFIGYDLNYRTLNNVKVFYICYLFPVFIVVTVLSVRFFEIDTGFRVELVKSNI